MRRLSLLGLLLSGGAFAQQPDLRFRIDLAFQLVSKREGPFLGRLYTPFGRHSTVAITALTEPGFNVTVSQRAQTFDDDADNESLDEYFIEDPGIWRVGKQYLPFGPQNLLRESVLAARADTNLLFEGIPVSVALFDGGRGRPNGALGRVGPRAYGASFASGRHLAVSGTALAVLRSPEGSPGPGGGWAQAYGFDAAYRVSRGIFRLEGLALRGGGLVESDRSILDLTFTRELRGRDYVLVGIAQDFGRGQTFLRGTANLTLNPNTAFEPFLVIRGTEVDRIGLGARVRF